MEAPTAVYRHRDGLYLPTEWAGGPWSRANQHGAPVIGLFAREVEGVAAELGLQPVRITVDLYRPVPVAPLRLTSHLARRGRRIAAIEMSLHREQEEAALCRASAVMMGNSTGSGVCWNAAAAVPPPPDAVDPVASTLSKEVRNRMPPGFHRSLELRAGSDQAGGFVWVTSPLHLIDGESITPFQRACALADMTMGMQMLMLRRVRSDIPTRVFMINTDTTIYWERPFVGSYLGFRGALLTEREGIGVAEAVLYDSIGRVGRAVQGALRQDPVAAP